MADTLDDTDNNSKKPATPDGQKPRRVAKTMLDTGLPQSQDVQQAHSASDNNDAPVRRVAKTMIYPIGNLHRLTMGSRQDIKAPTAASAAGPAITPITTSIDTQARAPQTVVPDPRATSSKISPIMPQATTATHAALSNTAAHAALNQDYQPVISALPEQKSDRRVARTLLFKPVRTLERENPAQTLSEKVEQASRDQDAQAAGTPVRKRDYVVAKTMLDHSVLFQMSSVNAAKQETRAHEIARERANEPLKPEVEPKKKALACKWVWQDDGYNKERFKLCTLCQQTVYDFKGMDKAEAEALIYKREKVEKPTIFKRTDGKFMINNCPLAVKRRKNIVLASLVAGLFVAGVITIGILFPPAPPPPPKPAALPQSSDPFAEHNARTQPTTIKNGDGVTYYSADTPPTAGDANGKAAAPTAQPYAQQTPVTQPPPAATPQQPAATTDDGSQFWQYSGDQNQGTQSNINDNPKMPDPAGGQTQPFNQSSR